MKVASNHCGGVRRIAPVTMFILLLAPIAASRAQDPLPGALEALRTYDWGSPFASLAPIDIAIIMTHGQADPRHYLEDRLLEVLASDAPRAAKDYVCRQLAAIGSVRSVPALGSLLGDAALAHMARTALEVIPGPEADAALREAIGHLEGDLRVGAIHSLGRRGDISSVTVLTALLQDADQRVIEASLLALASLPAPEADQAVRDYLLSARPETRLAAEVALLRIADRALAAGHLSAAAATYRLFDASEAEHLRCAAFLGLLRAEPEQAVGRWTEALSQQQAAWRRFAAESIRTHANDEQMVAIGAALPSIPVAGQVDFFDALRARRHEALRGAAVTAVAKNDVPLQLAALEVLAVSGEAADVPLLAHLAAAAEADVRAAAERSLGRLPARGADEALRRLLDESDPAVCSAAIRAVVARETPDAGPQLLRLASSHDDTVRQESLTALQTVADASMADALVRLLAQSRTGRERESLERAVWRSCSRIAPPDRQAAPVLAALIDADTTQQAALLPALGRIGGAASLAVIEQALEDRDAAVRDAAVRGLSNWPDSMVADRLLELARTGEKESHRIWALRGYARVIARQAAEQPQEVAAGLRQALELATRVEDRQLIVSRLTAARCAESLQLAVNLLEDPLLVRDALDATVALAEGMKDSHPQEAHAALDQAMTKTDNPELQLYITKLLWNMQLKQQAQAAAPSNND